MPPIWISKRIAALPIVDQWVAVVTVTRPVTHTLVVAVNNASAKEVLSPGAVQNGSQRKNPPTKITPAKLRAIICAVFNL